MNKYDIGWQKSIVLRMKSQEFFRCRLYKIFFFDEKVSY